MSSSKNLEYGKTSFLSKSNSSFIEEMYIKYIEKDPTLPASWENYFNTLNEDSMNVFNLKLISGARDNSMMTVEYNDDLLNSDKIFTKMWIFFIKLCIRIFIKSKFVCIYNLIC